MSFLLNVRIFFWTNSSHREFTVVLRIDILRFQSTNKWMQPFNSLLNIVIWFLSCENRRFSNIYIHSINDSSSYFHLFWLNVSIEWKRIIKELRWINSFPYEHFYISILCGIHLRSSFFGPLFYILILPCNS